MKRFLRLAEINIIQFRQNFNVHRWELKKRSHHNQQKVSSRFPQQRGKHIRRSGSCPPDRPDRPEENNMCLLCNIIYINIYITDITKLTRMASFWSIFFAQMPKIIKKIHKDVTVTMPRLLTLSWMASPKIDVISMFGLSVFASLENIDKW